MNPYFINYIIGEIDLSIIIFEEEYKKPANDLVLKVIIYDIIKNDPVSTMGLCKTKWDDNSISMQMIKEMRNNVRNFDSTVNDSINLKIYKYIGATFIVLNNQKFSFVTDDQLQKVCENDTLLDLVSDTFMS